MNTNLEKAIIQTLAYFDIFDFPLTKEELHRFLWNYKDTISFFDFIKQLEQIEHKNGYYFLSGRSVIVHDRQLAIPIIEKKLKIARRAAKKIRWIPFVRALFVCNTVASASASQESDIDVFIVIKKGRIWISRFLITIVLGFFRMRRTKTDVANKICLSFYVTDEHLDLEDVAIDGVDIYLMYWIDQLIPIYDPEGVGKNMIASNQWIKKNLPHALQGFQTLGKYRVDNKRLQSFVRKIFEKMWSGKYGDMLNQEAKKVQEKKMSRNYESVKDEPDTRVVINDTMLKFHENDRRLFFRERWKKRCEEIVNL